MFGLLTAALVIAFGAVEDSEPSIDASSSFAVDRPEGPEERAPAAAALRTTPSQTTSTPPDGAESTAVGPRVYARGIGELEGVVAAPEQGVLSAAPDNQPAPPTTVDATTSTETSVDPEVGGEGETTTTTVSTESTDTTAGTSTTEAGEGATTTTSQPAETTTSTAHPDGWVDTGNGVLVPPVLLSIRFCESTDNYSAANPNSSARGAYQFLTSSWAAYGHAARYGVSQAHLATRAQQDEAALITWQQDGTRPWAASSSCWS